MATNLASRGERRRGPERTHAPREVVGEMPGGASGLPPRHGLHIAPAETALRILLGYLFTSSQNA